MSEARTERGGLLACPGRLDRGEAPELLRRVRERLPGPGERLVIDLAPVRDFDSVGLAVLVRAVALALERGGEVRFQGASEELRSYFSLVSLDRLLRKSKAPREPFSPVLFLGDLAEPGVKALRMWFFVMVESFWGVLVRPFKGERIRWDRVVTEINAVGAQAVPIIGMIGFLIGIILVMQTSGKLREYGAELYVADMVGVSVTTEIGPLLAAIIAAARSGSAIAAEIGTMVVSEEVDALRQMGIHPVRFLVLPKVVALALSVPCLALFFILAAITGGLFFGAGVLGLPWGAYLEHTRDAVTQVDIIHSMIKSALFGAIVGQVGCALGIGVEGGSVGVGRATTFAVVLAIFLIILANALYVALFWIL